MRRRDILKLTAAAPVLAVFGAVSAPRWLGAQPAPGTNGARRSGPLQLDVVAARKELVNRKLAYVWAYQDRAQSLPSVPGPVILAAEGERLEIVVRNLLDEPHSFAIPGVVDSGEIAPGQSATLSFNAPAPGSYLYHDGLNAPVNRVMGLHGALIVLPAAGNAPYADPTPRIRRLFDDLGTTERFPGDPWTFDRSWLWLFWSLDLARHNAMETMPDGAVVSPSTFLDGYLPDYFFINGKSGYFASHDETITPLGNVGTPALLRTMNAGLPTHSPHIHGNHVYVLSISGALQNNLFKVDTWTLEPGAVVDVLLPFVQPPDAVPWPPSNPKEFPMSFVMHCHTEMSQTANGGNYPQGLVTHWELLSPKVGGPVVPVEHRAGQGTMRMFAPLSATGGKKTHGPHR